MVTTLNVVTIEGTVPFIKTVAWYTLSSFCHQYCDTH